MISLKRGMEFIIWQTITCFHIVNCANDWQFRTFLCKMILGIDWAHQKQDGFLTLESPLIRRIHSSCQKRWRAQCHLSRGELVVWLFGECLTGQNWTKTGQGRVGWCRMMTGEAAFLGFSPSDILVDCTRVSAMPICPNSQRTFVWLCFLALIFFQRFLMNFKNFFYQLFLNFFSQGFECSHCSSPAQLPLVISRRNTCGL